MSGSHVQALLFGDAGDVPNHPHWPLLVLKEAVRTDGGAEALARALEERYTRHGWRAAWRWGVYDFAHYHSTAHEVLGCCRGRARIRFGGGVGRTLEIAPGDVVIIPAGVGHQNLGSSADFQVCGGYPDGQEADLIRAEHTGRDPDIRRRLLAVPRPAADPIGGRGGALPEHWTERTGG